MREKKISVSCAHIINARNMKRTRQYILLFMVFALCMGCTNRRQSIRQETTPDKGTILSDDKNKKHRENGWYRIIDNSTNSIAPYPIVTVKELINLRVDTDFYGKSVLVGNMGKHKRKAWADATEQAIGKRIGFVFNDSVLTSPQVNARIESGNFQISTLQEYDMESLYHQLIQEKRDSLDSLFRANSWEKDTLFLNSLKPEEQDSIINSLDYTEAAAIVQGFEEEKLHK